MARDVVAGLSVELALGSSTILALDADYYDVENVVTLGGTFTQLFGCDTRLSSTPPNTTIERW